MVMTVDDQARLQYEAGGAVWVADAAVDVAFFQGRNIALAEQGRHDGRL